MSDHNHSSPSASPTTPSPALLNPPSSSSLSSSISTSSLPVNGMSSIALPLTHNSSLGSGPMGPGLGSSGSSSGYFTFAKAFNENYNNHDLSPRNAYPYMNNTHSPKINNKLESPHINEPYTPSNNNNNNHHTNKVLVSNNINYTFANHATASISSLTPSHKQQQGVVYNTNNNNHENSKHLFYPYSQPPTPSMNHNKINNNNNNGNNNNNNIELMHMDSHKPTKITHKHSLSSTQANLVVSPIFVNGGSGSSAEDTQIYNDLKRKLYSNKGNKISNDHGVINNGNNGNGGSPIHTHTNSMNHKNNFINNLMRISNETDASPAITHTPTNNNNNNSLYINTKKQNKTSSSNNPASVLIEPDELTPVFDINNEENEHYHEYNNNNPTHNNSGSNKLLIHTQDNINNNNEVNEEKNNDPVLENKLKNIINMNSSVHHNNDTNEHVINIYSSPLSSSSTVITNNNNGTPKNKRSSGNKNGTLGNKKSSRSNSNKNSIILSPRQIINLKDNSSNMSHDLLLDNHTTKLIKQDTSMLQHNQEHLFNNNNNKSIFNFNQEHIPLTSAHMSTNDLLHPTLLSSDESEGTGPTNNKNTVGQATRDSNKGESLDTDDMFYSRNKKLYYFLRPGSFKSLVILYILIAFFLLSISISLCALSYTNFITTYNIQILFFYPILIFYLNMILRTYFVNIHAIYRDLPYKLIFSDTALLVKHVLSYFFIPIQSFLVYRIFVLDRNTYNVELYPFVNLISVLFILSEWMELITRKTTKLIIMHHIAETVIACIYAWPGLSSELGNNDANNNRELAFIILSLQSGLDRLIAFIYPLTHVVIQGQKNKKLTDKRWKMGSMFAWPGLYNNNLNEQDQNNHNLNNNNNNSMADLNTNQENNNMNHLINNVIHMNNMNHDNTNNNTATNTLNINNNISSNTNSMNNKSKNNKPRTSKNKKNTNNNINNISGLFLKRLYTLAFFYYCFFVRGAVVILLSYYLYQHYFSIVYIYRILLIFFCIFFMLIDIEDYMLLYKRSSLYNPNS